MLVIPVLFGSVLGQWGRDIAQYLPSNAGNSFVSSIHETPSLSPWTGLIVLTSWVILLLLTATLTLTRRDV